jgi:hypothetical protein
MEATELKVMFHTTRLVDCFTRSPLGHVHTIPVPIVAGRLIRRKKFVGAVGAVVQPVVMIPPTAAGSSWFDACSSVAVPPATEPLFVGLPTPIVDAVAAFKVMPSS